MSMSMREALEYMGALVRGGLLPEPAAMTAGAVFGVSYQALLIAYWERP